MNSNEVSIANPITSKSITKIFDEIKLCNTKYLIINIGEHEFESIEVLKELKNMFIQKKDLLNRFNKIAFLHPASFENISMNTKKYNFFSNREKAKSWLKS
ncbi:MAG: hypothetical protein P8Z35_13815 [Ignavibacteriaceae bacterium]|jgi:hypothetical protein